MYNNLLDEDDDFPTINNSNLRSLFDNADVSVLPFGNPRNPDFTFVAPRQPSIRGPAPQIPTKVIVFAKPALIFKNGSDRSSLELVGKYGVALLSNATGPVEILIYKETTNVLTKFVIKPDLNVSLVHNFVKLQDKEVFYVKFDEQVGEVNKTEFLTQLKKGNATFLIPEAQECNNRPSVSTTNSNNRMSPLHNDATRSPVQASTSSLDTARGRPLIRTSFPAREFIRTLTTSSEHNIATPTEDTSTSENQIQNSGTHSTIDEIGSKLEIILEAIRDIKEQPNSLKTKNETLSRNLAEYKKRIDELCEELSQAKNEVDILEKKLVEKAEDFEQFKKENDNVNKKCLTHEQQCQTTEQQYKMTEQQYFMKEQQFQMNEQHLKEQMSSLQQTIVEYQEIIRSETLKNEEIKATNKDLLERIRTLNKTCEKLEKKNSPENRSLKVDAFGYIMKRHLNSMYQNIIRQLENDIRENPQIKEILHRNLKHECFGLMESYRKFVESGESLTENGQ